MSNGDPQILTLSVTGGHAISLGSRSQKVFAGKDGTIGRSEDCDWVLTGPGVSRVHAVVHCLNGMYFIEDRSSNGMLMNGKPLLKGDPSALKEGDHLQIDAFDIVAQLRAGTPEVMQEAASAPPPQAVRAPAPASAPPPLDAFDFGMPPAAPQASPAYAPPPAAAFDFGMPPAAPQASPAYAPPPAEPFDFGLPPAAPPQSAPAYAPSPAHARPAADPFDFGLSPAQPAAPAGYGGDSLIPGAPATPFGGGGDSLIPGAPAAPYPGGGDSLIPGAPAATADELDPLNLLGGFGAPEPAPVAPAAPPPSWNHSASTEDYFRPPSTDVQRKAAALPDNWDAEFADLAAPAPQAPTPQAVPRAAAPMMPSPMQPQPVVPQPIHAQPVMPQPVQPQPIHPQPVMPQPMPPQPIHAQPVMPQPVQPQPVQPQPVQPQPVQAQRPAVVAPMPAAGGELDAIFRIVVDGVMDVLRARAEIKNTFRLPVTVIQKSENNPLKFAMGVDEAMQKIMAPPNAAFLSGPAAFDDAFDDIRCHQMAMLAGVRAGFDSLLRHFDPANFEREADAGGRHAFGGKGRYWERFREHYTGLAGDPDECFRRLFGDEFARAYEEQLARLKSARHARSARAH